MHKIYFSKYHGAGNDFVLIDNRKQVYNDLLISEYWPKKVVDVCNRRTGIGADGILVINAHDELDFNLLYYNSDGSAAFCGNGARCAVHWMHKNTKIDREISFLAYDGIHTALVMPNKQIKVSMGNVDEIAGYGTSDYILDTGTLHYVLFVDNLDKVDIVKEGRSIRYHKDFCDRGGINVNFVYRVNDTTLDLRTYERGVEDETLSCGTGAVAAAIAATIDQCHIESGQGWAGTRKEDQGAPSKCAGSQSCSAISILVNTRGGALKVDFQKFGHHFVNISLTGPAVCVFNGEIE